MGCFHVIARPRKVPLWGNRKVCFQERDSVCVCLCLLAELSPWSVYVGEADYWGNLGNLTGFFDVCLLLLNHILWSDEILLLFFLISLSTHVYVILWLFFRAVSTFWIANPNNNLISNAAAGSQVIISELWKKNNFFHVVQGNLWPRVERLLLIDRLTIIKKAKKIKLHWLWCSWTLHIIKDLHAHKKLSINKKGI